MPARWTSGANVGPPPPPRVPTLAADVGRQGGRCTSHLAPPTLPRYLGKVPPCRYIRPLLWLALSVLGGHTSNAASEGCHSIAQLIMSDLQTSMGDDILQMTVCLRDGKEAVEQLKATYPDEAKNAELSRHHG